MRPNYCWDALMIKFQVAAFYLETFRVLPASLETREYGMLSQQYLLLFIKSVLFEQTSPLKVCVKQ